MADPDSTLIEDLRRTVHREVERLGEKQDKTTAAVHELKTSIALLVDKVATLGELEGRIRVLELAQARMYGAAAAIGAVCGGAAAGLTRVIGG